MRQREGVKAMTVGELLTSVQWIASVEVETPCGVDADGEKEYDTVWRDILLPCKQTMLPEAVAALEIESAAVLNYSDGFGGYRPTLLIQTK